MDKSEICKQRGYHTWDDKDKDCFCSTLGETYEDMDVEFNCFTCGAHAEGTVTWNVE